MALSDSAPTGRSPPGTSASATRAGSSPAITVRSARLPWVLRAARSSPRDIPAGAEVNLHRLAGVPIAGYLQHGRTREAAVGEQHRLAEPRPPGHGLDVERYA